MGTYNLTFEAYFPYCFLIYLCGYFLTNTRGKTCYTRRLRLLRYGEDYFSSLRISSSRNVLAAVRKMRILLEPRFKS